MSRIQNTVQREQVGELEALAIRHPQFSAQLFLQGAHLTHYAPSGQGNWLWLSPQAQYRQGRAIRGGVPVCWPWFGDPARNPAAVARQISSTSAHGFARHQRWTWVTVDESDDAVRVVLALDASEGFAPLWSGQARVQAEFTFTGQGCRIALITENVGTTPLALSQALHTYLPVADVATAEIHGLDGAAYLDTLADWQRKQQQGAVRFVGETDRIYLQHGRLRLVTPANCRVLQGEGSGSAVVWNPGPEKAARLSDFGAEDWRNMVCIETANAADDSVTLPPGGQTRLVLMLQNG
ncbi:MAG: D-hexose-6-phosphate mutarotase [Marinobacter sp.]|nr:D-hexose-6-phosphate mutarotase [Marinobacter sp.]